MSRRHVNLIPFPVGRTKNAPWQRDEECDLCRDDGIVDVGRDPTSGTNQTAPCPRCYVGFMVEFGYGRGELIVGNRRQLVFYQSSNSPWGSGGYWARNQALAQMLAPQGVSEPLPLEENERRMKVVNRMLAWGEWTEELLDELYEGDEVGRKAHDILVRAARRHDPMEIVF